MSFCDNSLTRYCQTAYGSEMALGQAFDSFPVLGSSSGKAHAGASVGACGETRPAAATAELSTRSQDTSVLGRELGAVQHCCTGPRARALSLNTDVGLAPLARYLPGLKHQSPWKGNDTTVCPRWTRQGAHFNFEICLIFFQTYSIFSASELSVSIGCRKEKRWRHIQGQEEDSWGSRSCHA